SAFTPYTHFASTAYCTPSTTEAWTCGTNCEANPDFAPVASGGDGEIDTEPTLAPLDANLFPGVPSNVEVHAGFYESFTKSAVSVLSAAQKSIAAGNTTRVTVVGHGLGGAIASIAAVYLQLHIHGVKIQAFTFGQPRVGNEAFANYVDAKLDITRINNKKDPSPILPGLFLGYTSFSGEVHIGENNIWYACPGQDNLSTMCSTGDVPTLFDGDVNDHGGPYNGIEMGC
ncbi:hypothetical protein BGW38_001851, partial [Lunasporangiospora selenospora]